MYRKDNQMTDKKLLNEVNQLICINWVVVTIDFGPQASWITWRQFYTKDYKKIARNYEETTRAQGWLKQRTTLWDSDGEPLLIAKKELS